ncbi:hypothetical protein MMC17_009210 [Xylographa soralifera]|nr:hypothetical protein [Xylographa soralifera]
MALLLTFERQDSIFGSLWCRQSAELTGRHKQQYNILSVLYLASHFQLVLYPLKWMPALEPLGKGATGQVHQSFLNGQIAFAFKRSIEDPRRGDEARFKAIALEIRVLRDPAIRKHPNIVDLLGLAWDVDMIKNSVWPVLVFPKATFGNLRQFLKNTDHGVLSLGSTLQHCKGVVSAISTMHAANIIHGDLKPENIVVTENARGESVLQLIDFGYSSYGSRHEDLVIMPFSPPWAAPEHEWSEITVIAAKRMDVYSLGMISAFLVFHNDWSGFEVELKLSASSENNGELKYRDLYGPPGQRTCVLRLLMLYLRDTEHAFSKLPDSLVHYFRASLSCAEAEGRARTTNIHLLSTLLDQATQDELEDELATNEQLVAMSLPLEALSSLYTVPPHEVPVLPSYPIAFEYLHFLVREHIFRAINRIALDTETCPQCWFLAVTQVSYCYRIGFGTDQNLDKAQEWREIMAERFLTVPDIGELVGRIQSGVTEPIKDDPDNELSVNKLFEKGLDFFDLADQLVEGSEIKEVTRRIESDCAARTDAFGDESEISMYYKIILSLLYGKQGMLKKAKELQMTVFSVLERDDPKSSNAIILAGVLVTTLHEEGSLIEAKSLQERYVQYTTEVYDLHHPRTLQGMTKLGAILSDASEYEAAGALAKTVYKLSCESLGNTHPSTISYKQHLISSLRDLGSLNDARAMAEDTLRLSEQVLGVDDPTTLSLHSTFALILYDLELWEETEQHLLVAYHGFQSVVGPTNASTLQTAASLSSLYCNRRQLDKAERIIASLLESSYDLYPTSKIALTAKTNLGSLKMLREEWQAAEAVFLEIIDTLEQWNGEKPLSFLAPQSHLGQIYQAQGKLDDAEKWQRRAVSKAESIYQPPHPVLATIYHNLGLVLHLKGQRDEAIELAGKCIDMRQKLLGENHEATQQGLEYYNSFVDSLTG